MSLGFILKQFASNAALYDDSGDELVKTYCSQLLIGLSARLQLYTFACYFKNQSILSYAYLSNQLHYLHISNSVLICAEFTLPSKLKTVNEQEQH